VHNKLALLRGHLLQDGQHVLGAHVRESCEGRSVSIKLFADSLA
jgi:hypothetical protein